MPSSQYPSTRKSPPLPAKSAKNKKMVGVDGNMWHSKQSSNGVYRWVRVSVPVSKKRTTAGKSYKSFCTANKVDTECYSDPNCTWTKRGCVARKGVRVGDVYQGPRMEQHVPTSRYKSFCTNKSDTQCYSDPNCTWTKRGCVARKGVPAGDIYQGPRME